MMHSHQLLRRSLAKSMSNKNIVPNRIKMNTQLIFNNSMLQYNKSRYMFSKQHDNINININISNITNNTNRHKQNQQIPQKPAKSTSSLPTFSELQLKQLLNQPNQLRSVILDHINKFGEMKLQKYWNISLTDSQYGYYSQSNVFSKQGDFTTSPEISPLFGEMIAVWIVYFLNKIQVLDEVTQAVNRKFRIVEFGPGRGLLMRDIVKALHDMKIDNYFQISFVQVSEYNRQCQQQNIFEQFKKYDNFFKFQYQNPTKQVQSFTNQSQFKDIQLKWFNNFEILIKQDYDKLKQNKSLPVTIFLMNEYFDALPTNILEYTQKGWRQKVLGKGNNPEFPLELKNSSVQIPEKMRPNIKDPKIGDRIQVSHQSLITMDTMCKLLLHTKGSILNIDYGGQVNYSNSIRAIKNHKFIPEPYFWQIPGKCDLSAYVNFAGLGDFAQSNKGTYLIIFFKQLIGIRSFQSIPQGYFLEAMGINPRIQILEKNMNKKQKQRLQSEYHRLVHPQQMGEIFKVQCVTLKQYGEVYPWVEDKEGEY